MRNPLNNMTNIEIQYQTIFLFLPLKNSKTRKQKIQRYFGRHVQSLEYQSVE